MKYFHRWIQFIKERFNPLSYSIMIFFFIGAHYILYLDFLKQKATPSFPNILHLTPLILAIFLFFFKLRLFDEVKDIESDIVHHPERPIPRGILDKNDLLRVVFILIVLEFVLFSFYGFWALISILFAISYSLAMYKEFFVKTWLRSHLTTYAVTHTFVVVFISITIFSALFKQPFLEIPRELAYFSIASWFTFNIFEFGRKTFALSEEKKGVDSYSKKFGKFGAVMLVMIMAVLSSVLISRTVPSISNVLYLLLIPLGITGLLYITTNNLYLAKTYRTITSLYIMLTYGIVTFLW